MVGRQNNGEPEMHIFINDSPSPDTSNTAGFPAIPDYNVSEQVTDVHNTLETNLNLSELLLL